MHLCFMVEIYGLTLDFAMFVLQIWCQTLVEKPLVGVQKTACDSAKDRLLHREMPSFALPQISICFIV